ncbi:MAG: hypothetical protein IKB64_03490 [Paludibacteraceae bacterium]|nr:hypothetical protein [Paludibacteraceae bacterium]
MIHFDKINVRESLEDFLKIEYTDGLQNEFNTMEALINHIKKDTLVGKYKTKSFALGVTDNIRMLGNGNDRYVLGVDDYTNAVETVEARFDTTKLMGIFAITDETIVKGTTDGSIFDVLNDSLGRMNLALKHTMNRFTYGSKSGKIGVLNGAATITSATDTMPTLADFVMTNSLSILPGMGVLIVDGENRYQGKVWQKYSAGVGVERIIVLLDADDEPEAIATGAEVYSRQLNAATIVPEYTGIQDIIFTEDNEIFGVDRSVFKTLNCTVEDLDGEILTESKLRDMADHVEVSCADDSSIKLVASNHKIVSTVEKQMYQFKDYTIDTAGQAFHLGRKNIIFDTYQLYKDKYSRDKNVVLLDTDKIGELVRKEFSWLTSGQHQILERRDGSEMYEGIMTKYADMYIDAFKSHAGFINAAEEYVLND